MFGMSASQVQTAEELHSDVSKGWGEELNAILAYKKKS